MNIKKINHLIWVLPLCLAVAVACGLYWFWQQGQENITFVGKLEFITDNEIVTRGSYELEEGELPPRDMPIGGVLGFKVDSATKFTKDSIEFPTEENALKIGTTFDIEDLPHQKETGSLDDMISLFNNHQVIYITVKFSVSTAEDISKIPASAVLYRTFSGVYDSQESNE